MVGVSNETATAELHYTDLGDAETFVELCRSHGLQRLCPSCSADAGQTHGWKSPGTGVVLLTDCDPTETTIEKGKERDPGYCSYTTIRGPVAAAEALYRDIVESATYIKGEFSPLTTDGRVVVSLDGARRERDDGEDACDFESLFEWLCPPTRKPAYDHVAVSIPGSDAETLRESGFDGVAALPSGATYGSGVER